MNERADVATTSLEQQPGGPASEEPTGRKAEILSAAAEVFAERGYEAGSMRQIAARVGVTEPALYRHFPGKEALFLGILRLTAGTLRREAESLIDGVRAETLREQLIAAFGDRRRAIQAYAPVLRMVISAAAHNPTFLEEWRRQMVLPLMSRLVDKAAEIDAVLGAPDADATRASRVRSLIAMFVGYFVTSLVLADDADEHIADACIRVMGWEQAPPG